MNLFDLDQPLLHLGSSATNPHWTIRNAVEGVQIFGGIGSGKTSGSGRILALNYLKHNFGGLVLTVKPDEKDSWLEYCKLAGRESDLIIVEPGGKYYFNFLQYEASRASSESGITDNLVQVLKTVIRAGNEKDSGKSDDPFWESALDMLIFNVIDLCRLAYESISLQKIYEIVQTIPKENEILKPKTEDGQCKAFQKAVELARAKVIKIVDDWENGLSERDKKELYKNPILYEERLLDAVPEARLLRFLDEFFMEGYKNLNDRTRSIIDFSFSGFLFRLLREPVFSLFCRYSANFSPDDSLQGKIIILNLPVKIYHKVGRDCQILFKYIWQRRMEQRNVLLNNRPVFLWADEAQNFLHEHDADFQATARSSRIATVYISQNLPNYFGSMGGDKSKYKVKSFLGTLNTKIFHANADMETNEFASKLVGEGFIIDETESTNFGKDYSKGVSKSYKLERLIRPEEFIRLLTGGIKNHYLVGGIVHRQGEIITDNMNHKKVSFSQNYKFNH